VILRNNDAIQLGVNVVRFRERNKQGASVELPPAEIAPAPAAPVRRINPVPVAAKAPPPPPPKSDPKPPVKDARVQVQPPPSKPPMAVAGCPVCGRQGAAVPNTNKRRCPSCGILY
jgi:hypothetical protein